MIMPASILPPTLDHHYDYYVVMIKISLEGEGNELDRFEENTVSRFRHSLSICFSSIPDR